MRVLAINDISCVGKCSLTVALPVISACGVTCDVLPTALLSTHTGGFDGYTFLDLSDEIPRILTHWEGLGLTFDFIYSGYLGNISQIETVLAVKRKFLKPNGKFIVDPVMGDGGKLYAHFDYHFVEKCVLYATKRILSCQTSPKPVCFREKATPKRALGCLRKKS
ncbi:MAG: hypothetical protein ACLR06_00015 [Christensenellaceae bacterium]